MSMRMRLREKRILIQKRNDFFWNCNEFFFEIRSQTNIQKETKTIVGDDSNEKKDCCCCPQHQYLLTTLHQLQGNDFLFFFFVFVFLVCFH
jgi:hypothetical protein